MIAYIKGKVGALSENGVVVENQGIGFFISVPVSLSQRLRVGDEVKLHTHMSVREDDISLFGFGSADELAVFRMLIGVSGIGPKAALSILSTLSVDELGMAVMLGEAKKIAASPGIGKKTAEKIILELKDKFNPEDLINAGDTGADAGVASVDADAVEALVALGYSTPAALSAVKAAMKEDSTGEPEKILKLALKYV